VPLLHDKSAAVCYAEHDQTVYRYRLTAQVPVDELAAEPSARLLTLVPRQPAGADAARSGRPESARGGRQLG
jgi:hypothetical protein